MENQPDRPVREIELDAGEDNPQKAWLDAIRELEGHRPVKAAHKKSAPAEKESAVFSGGKDETVVADDLSGPELLDRALAKTQRAQEMLAKFRSDHAYLIAPNVFDMWETHLQETLVLLNRERDRLSREG